MRLNDANRIVFTAVVHDDDFVRAKALCQHAFERPTDVVRPIEGRDDHTDTFNHSSSFVLRLQENRDT